MTKPKGSFTARWQFLFGAQTASTIILFWNAVPLYQEIRADPAAHEARPENLVWALSSIVLRQAGYWIYHRINSPPPQYPNALIGNVIRFVARMSFVFATSAFGLMFVTQKPGFHIPASRYVVTLLGLFSQYCYAQESDRLGRAFVGRNKKSEPSH
jgi:hypothetical protein